MAPPSSVSSSWLESTIRRFGELGPRGVAVLAAILDELPVHELAALAFDWEGTWARQKQIIPHGSWSSYGFVTDRGWGKTDTNTYFAIGEVAEGRARRLALIGQSEAKTIEILVTGETGLLNRTPPWLGAEWEPSTNRVRFGNGAIATVYTAQEPAGLRGPQHDLALATEIAAWPASTRDETMQNLRLGLRLGRGQLLWDSTPRRRNPLIRERLQLAARHPDRHIVVFGRTDENLINLSPSAVAEWREQWGGTARGAEELDGEFLDDAEDALFKQVWIDRARRGWPEKLVRRVISVDPAITSDPRSSDATGIVEMGLGVDSQILVLRNRSGVHRAEVWPGMVIDDYVRGGCDLILIETNRGGSAWAALLRGACRERGLSLLELGPDEVPGHRPGVVYLRSFTARGQKAVRASGAAALVERGRVSFVAGELGDLEERLCAFTGEAGEIDDCVDAFVAGCHELTGLAHDKPDPRAAFRGIAEMGKALLEAPTISQRARLGGGVSVVELLPRGSGGRI